MLTLARAFPGWTAGLGDFAKLPPELRAEIWRLALITTASIKITRRKNESPWRRRWDEDYILSSQLSTNTTSTNQQPRAPPPPFPSIPLIRASKALNVEASPVLYHNTRFLFPDAPTLETFVDRIGEMAFSLSDIEVASTSTSDAAAQLSVLKRLHNPRRIVLPAPVCAPRFSPLASAAARDVWRWIKPIVVRRGGEYMLARTVRPYRYGQVLEDGTPAWEDEPGSREDQEKRLRAFRFDVSSLLVFRTDDGNGFLVPDDEVRADMFRDLVVARWRMSLEWRDET